MGSDPKRGALAGRRGGHIYFHQIWRDQEGFLRFWSEELATKL